MTREDFKVHINEDNELIISLEKKSEEKEEDKKRKGTYLRREFSYPQFQQSLLLPDNIEREKISAKVENGVIPLAAKRQILSVFNRERCTKVLPSQTSRFVSL